MIVLKSQQDIVKMREAGRIVAEVLQLMRERVRPGMTTGELDRLAHEHIAKRGGKSAFKGYRGYPAQICTMLNAELVHGIPNDRRVLQEGDVLSLDVGVLREGFVGDAGTTIAVGEVSREARRLMQVTEESLYAGIECARAGNRIGDISAAVQRHVEAAGFSVIREYTGHGVGRQMHEDPQVPNFGRSGRGLALKPGMTLAIEPMVAQGDWHTYVLDDGWTVVTADGSLSAYYEHSIAITDNGPLILTEL
jgi:methionyl aminopeptidase